METDFSRIEIVNESSTFDFTKQSWKDDVTFVLDDKRLYASKCVIAIFSPVFESMFGTDFKEKTENEVALPGKNVEDFLEFLHCLYPTSKRTVTRENVFQVLPLADEYQVRPLLEKCEDVLTKHVTGSEEEFSISQILKGYSLATRHNLSKVDHICVEKLLNENNFASICSQAEMIMDKDTLSKFKSDIIAEQAKRMNEVTTMLVKLTLKSSNIDTNGFENAMGTMLEHTIENVLDPTLKHGESSKSVKLWNASFSLQISVANKEINRQKEHEKCLSVYLGCTLPEDNMTCKVKAVIVLESVCAAENIIVAKENFDHQYKPPYFAYGYDHFEKLSKFLTGASKTNENYTAKLVVYILANQPEVDLCEPISGEELSLENEDGPL